MKQQQQHVVLGEQDSKNYADTIAELVEDGELPSGLAPYIVQVFAPDASYIGAYIRIDGPLIQQSSGPEPAWRRWVWINDAWETRTFDPKLQLDSYLASTLPHSFIRCRAFILMNNKYISNAAFTYDLDYVRNRRNANNTTDVAH